MINQAFALLLLAMGTLSLGPIHRYCKCDKWTPSSSVLDPTGVYCANLDHGCNAGEQCKPVPGTDYGVCDKWKPPVPGGDLDPFGTYCLELDPTGKYSCGLGKKCQQMPGSQYGKCVPDLDPTGVYCVEDNQCRFDEKCGASGNTNHGYCVHELDPTGKYCAGSSDCRWYLFEKCVNGECQKIIDRSIIH